MNKRMAAIIKMLSSTSDGEVVNAARMLGRMLKDHGKDWNDLGEYLSRWNTISDRENTAKPAAAPPRHTTTNAVKPGWERRTNSDLPPVDIDIVKDQVEELLSNWLSRLNRKDSNFIESMSESFDLYGKNTFVSHAQANWVQSLYIQYIDNKGRRR